MLARITAQDGVLEAWTDRSGGRIVVAVRPERTSTAAATRATIALVSSALAPHYGVSEVAGRDAEAAVRACQAGGNDWLRSGETNALSIEEARILAGSEARAVARQAGLDAAEQARFEALVRDALVLAFGEQERVGDVAGGGLVERYRAAIDEAAAGLGLPPGRAARLREAIAAARAARR